VAVEMPGAGGLVWGIAIVLFALWALCFFVAHLGAVIHPPLVLAAVAIIDNPTTGRGNRAV